MSDKKQSSVEWLEEQLKKGVDFNPLDKNSYLDSVEKIFEQAKEMHKEEMFEYIKQKYCIGQMSLEFHTLEFEQYYNEHYGK